MRMGMRGFPLLDLVLSFLLSPGTSSGFTLEHLSITVLYDNNPYGKGLKTAWGFSCFLKAKGRGILFDTGGDGKMLLENMGKLGLSPSEIEVVVLSHIHPDHTGGLWSLLERKESLPIYLPSSFPGWFKARARRYGAEVREVREPGEILPGVYTTGEMGGGIKEQSLVVNTKGGLVIITGCAHPGILKIISRAKGMFKRKVLLVMGGFHLNWSSEGRIREVVRGFRKAGVLYVAPCYCSGQSARRLFREEYGPHYIEAGVGKTLTLQSLR